MVLTEEVLNYLAGCEGEHNELLERLARIPAPSGMEDKRVEFIKDWFLKNGAENVIVDEAKNVIVPVNVENAEKIVVFMAHTDLVFPDLEPLPFSKDEKYMYCPGIGDDTACLTTLMITSRYVIQNKFSSGVGVLFVANSCEEGLGNLKGVRQIMKNYGDRIVELYTFDGSYDLLINSCVGSHRYEITFSTEGGHSYGAFGNRNAIFAMSDLICKLYACSLPEKGGAKTTYNVGVVEGGTSVNTIAESAKMLYEYRSNDRECLSYMQKFFNDKIEEAKRLGLAEIEVKLIGDRPCDGDVDKGRLQEITDFAIKVCQKHSGIPCRVTAGSTDANVPLSLGIPAVCVGTHLSSGAHTRAEKILISSIPVGLKISAEIILSFFK